jgi:predicted signal transduction protein with EAL and GGDEF domain
MPRWLVIGLFVAIVAALAVIVWWEFSRTRSAPRSVSRAVKAYLAAEDSVPASPGQEEMKRGSDAWN